LKLKQNSIVIYVSNNNNLNSNNIKIYNNNILMTNNEHSGVIYSKGINKNINIELNNNNQIISYGLDSTALYLEESNLISNNTNIKTKSISFV